MIMAPPGRFSTMTCSFRKRSHENIARAPRAIRGDDAERPRWVILRSRPRERGGGEDCKTGQKPNAETLHGTEPFQPLACQLSFNRRLALPARIFSFSTAGMSRSRISLIARGFSDVSGGASLP